MRIRRTHGRASYLSDNNDSRGRSRTKYVGIGLVFGAGVGMSFGAAFGAAFGNVGLGVALGPIFGAVFGMAIGAVLSASGGKGRDDV